MTFESSFFKERTRELNFTRIDTLIFSKKAKAHILHTLKSAIPFGAHVALYNPKQLLTELMAEVQKEKKCTLTLAHHQVLTADVHLIEPDALTENGAFVTPAESALLQGASLIGVGTELHYTAQNPATHDFVPLAAIITEKGIKQITSSLSKSPSILSGASPLQPQAP